MLSLLLLLTALYRDPALAPSRWGPSDRLGRAGGRVSARPPWHSCSPPNRTPASSSPGQEISTAFHRCRDDPPGAPSPGCGGCITDASSTARNSWIRRRKPWSRRTTAMAAASLLAIQQHPRRLAALPLHIAVVGLGAGTIAALGENRRHRSVSSRSTRGRNVRAAILHVSLRQPRVRERRDRGREAVARARPPRRLGARAPTTLLAVDASPAMRSRSTS